MFVSRDARNKINGVFRQAQENIPVEELEENHPDVIAFLSKNIPPQSKIVAIEQQNPITHRALRELILAIGQLYPAGQSTQFYQRALAAELAIQVERAKL